MSLIKKATLNMLRAAMAKAQKLGHNPLSVLKSYKDTAIRNVKSQLKAEDLLKAKKFGIPNAEKLINMSPVEGIFKAISPTSGSKILQRAGSRAALGGVKPKAIQPKPFTDEMII